MPIYASDEELTGPPPVSDEVVEEFIELLHRPSTKSPIEQQLPNKALDDIIELSKNDNGIHMYLTMLERREITYQGALEQMVIYLANTSSVYKKELLRVLQNNTAPISFNIPKESVNNFIKDNSELFTKKD